VKIAVDVCIGPRAQQHLRDAGHEVVAAAEHGEPDRQWFARALQAGVEIVISADSDIEILAYDARVEVFKPAQGERACFVVARLLAQHPAPLNAIQEAATKIWASLTPSMRVSLLDETGLVPAETGLAALVAAGLALPGLDRPAFPSGAARHALAQRGLLEIAPAVPMARSGPGWHSPRRVTDLGHQVAAAGLAPLFMTEAAVAAILDEDEDDALPGQVVRFEPRRWHEEELLRSTSDEPDASLRPR
jgi:hypothetical protein